MKKVQRWRSLHRYGAYSLTLPSPLPRTRQARSGIQDPMAKPFLEVCPVQEPEESGDGSERGETHEGCSDVVRRRCCVPRWRRVRHLRHSRGCFGVLPQCVSSCRRSAFCAATKGMWTDGIEPERRGRHWSRGCGSDGGRGEANQTESISSAGKEGAYACYVSLPYLRFPQGRSRRRRGCL
ncbi:hypothetical protein SEVIR_5G280875v4 [Setaria viridis]